MYFFLQPTDAVGAGGVQRELFPFHVPPTARGWITYNFRGHPVISSMVHMIFHDDILTSFVPHGQSALTVIIPSGSTAASQLHIARFIGSQTPTHAVARIMPCPAR